MWWVSRMLLQLLSVQQQLQLYPWRSVIIPLWIQKLEAARLNPHLMIPEHHVVVPDGVLELI